MGEPINAYVAISLTKPDAKLLRSHSPKEAVGMCRALIDINKRRTKGNVWIYQMNEALERRKRRRASHVAGP